MLGKISVELCAIVFCMRKCGNLLYLCCENLTEKVHSILHAVSEMMRWGDLINTKRLVQRTLLLFPGAARKSAWNSIEQRIL